MVVTQTAPRAVRPSPGSDSSQSRKCKADKSVPVQAGPGDRETVVLACQCPRAIQTEIAGAVCYSFNSAARPGPEPRPELKLAVTIQHPVLTNDNRSTAEYGEGSIWFPGSAWEPASWRLCLLSPLHRSHADASHGKQSFQVCGPRQSLGPRMPSALLYVLCTLCGISSLDSRSIPPR